MSTYSLSAAEAARLRATVDALRADLDHARADADYWRAVASQPRRRSRSVTRPAPPEGGLALLLEAAEAADAEQRQPDALAILEAADERFPDNPAVLLMQADIQERLGQLIAARTTANRLLEVASSPSARERRERIVGRLRSLHPRYQPIPRRPIARADGPALLVQPEPSDAAVSQLLHTIGTVVIQAHHPVLAPRSSDDPEGPVLDVQLADEAAAAADHARRIRARAIIATGNPPTVDSAIVARVAAAACDVPLILLVRPGVIDYDSGDRPEDSAWRSVVGAAAHVVTVDHTLADNVIAALGSFGAQSEVTDGA